MARILTIVAVAAIIAASPTHPAGAHGPRQLDGQVLDATLGAPLQGVTVRLFGEDPETPLDEVTTDAEGRFTLPHVPEGPAFLVVESPVIEPIVHPIPPGDALEPLVLTASSTYGTVVRAPGASRPKTASSTRVDSQRIALVPTQTAEDALRLVPGLLLVQHGSEGKGHQFFLRGFDAIHGADLELRVDAIPVNEWSNIHAQGYIDLGFLVPELITSVEVTKGPFTLDQGLFGMAGSARYHVGVPTDSLGFRAAYTAGLTNRHRLLLSWSPEDGEGHEFIAAEALHDNGYGQQRQSRRLNLSGRKRLLEGDAGQLDLFAAAYHGAFQLPGPLRAEDVDAGRLGFHDAYDQDAAGTSTRALASLSWRHELDNHRLQAGAWGAWRYLTLLENFTGFLVDPERGDRRAQRQATGSFGADLQWDSRLYEGLVLRTSAGLRGDTFEQREDHVDQQPAPSLIARRRSLSGVQLGAHAYAGLGWKVELGDASSFRVDAGARVDLVHVDVTDHLGDVEGGDTLAALSPRASLRWTPLEALSLFAAYGRGVRPPEARAFSGFDASREGLSEERYVGDEGPSLTTSDAVELGLTWSPGLELQVSLSGFATFIERESVFDHVSGTNLELNGTRRLGGELAIAAMPLPWLRLHADLTLVDARFAESGNPVPLAPWLVGAFEALVISADGFTAGLRLQGVAPRTLPHGATGATLLSLDASLGYRWRWLSLSLEVENVLDRRSREGEYHYASHWRPGSPASELPAMHFVGGSPLDARLTMGARW